MKTQYRILNTAPGLYFLQKKLVGLVWVNVDIATNFETIKSLLDKLQEGKRYSKIVVTTKTFLLCLALVIPAAAKADYTMQCGFEPSTKPLQCLNGHYSCQCTPNGQCQWILTGC